MKDDLNGVADSIEQTTGTVIMIPLIRIGTKYNYDQINYFGIPEIGYSCEYRLDPCYEYIFEYDSEKNSVDILH